MQPKHGISVVIRSTKCSGAPLQIVGLTSMGKFYISVQLLIFKLVRRILIPFYFFYFFILRFSVLNVYFPFIICAWWCYWLLILHLLCWNYEHQVCYYGISHKLLWACSTRQKRLRFHGSHSQDKLLEGSILLMVILLLFWGILLMKFLILLGNLLWQCYSN